MKTKFIQSLRAKLMEIFHPWDFRKVGGCKSREHRCSCTDKDCTDNGLETELMGKESQENFPDSLTAEAKADAKESHSLQEANLNDTPHSYQTLSESITMIKSKSDTNTECSEQSSSGQTSSESITVENEWADHEFQCANEERQLLLQRILIKVLIICVLALLTLLIAPKSRAHDQQSMASLSVGVLYPNCLDITAQYERSTTYHSAWAVELEGYLRWRKCPDCRQVCTVSFWDYYRSYHIGMVYKPCVYRTRNQHGRLRLGASLGYDDRKILGGGLLGYEQTYCLRYGCEVFWTAKMDVQVLAKSWLRPGVSIGLRLPI